MNDKLSLMAIHPPIVKSIKQEGALCVITLTSGAQHSFPLAQIPKGPHKSFENNMDQTPINFGRVDFFYPADDLTIPYASMKSTYVEFKAYVPDGTSGSTILGVKYRVDGGDWVDSVPNVRKKINLANVTPGPHLFEVMVNTNGAEHTHHVRWFNAGE